MCNDWNINCSSIAYDININNKFSLFSTNRIQMIYKLSPKKSRDVKTLIDAKTKRAAISYFATLLHLNKEDLLKNFSIR
jgi:chromatin segregation and condensation protein Rec8/ScpA/Scc1 (kleisin family)